jgi:hypothetical protein
LATDYTDFHRFKRDLETKISVIRVICGFFLPDWEEDKSIGTAKDTQKNAQYGIDALGRD